MTTEKFTSEQVLAEARQQSRVLNDNAARMLRAYDTLLSERTELCEDEGCPHHGIKHVCVNERTAAAVEDVMVEAACISFVGIGWHEGDPNRKENMRLTMRAALTAALSIRGGKDGNAP